MAPPKPDSRVRDADPQTGKYDEIFKNFKTGDILLFHGENYWFSYVVEWFTWSKFSHIGIILKDPTYIDYQLKGYYLLESGTESFPDAVYHKIEFGVQIVDLEKLFNNYQGEIYYRSLQLPSDNEKQIYDIKIPTVLSKIWKKICHLKYDDEIWDLFRVEFGINWGDMKRKNKFFCSALTAFIYSQFQFFDKPVEWDLMTPQAFDDNGIIDDMLKLDLALVAKRKILINDSFPHNPENNSKNTGENILESTVENNNYYTNECIVPLSSDDL